MAEQEGLSYREAKQVVETDLFLDEYPRWNIGSPHWSVILHEMFLHAASQGWKEAECMCHWGHQGSIREPNYEVDQSALHLIGYHTSQRELRDVYHSVYLLNRAPGFPSCGEVKRRAIQEILSSLQERLQRQTPSTDAKDAPGNKWIQLLCQHMRWPCRLPTGRSRKLLQACRVTWTDSTMSQEEGFGPIVKAEAGIEHDLEATVEGDLGVDTELKPEVHISNTLGVGLRTGQEPELKIIMKLIPEMDGPILRTISGNP